MNSFEEKIDFDQHDKKKKIGNYVLGTSLLIQGKLQEKVPLEKLKWEFIH